MESQEGLEVLDPKDLKVLQVVSVHYVLLDKKEQREM